MTLSHSSPWRKLAGWPFSKKILSPQRYPFDSNYFFKIDFVTLKSINKVLALYTSYYHHKVTPLRGFVFSKHTCIKQVDKVGGLVQVSKRNITPKSPGCMVLLYRTFHFSKKNHPLVTPKNCVLFRMYFFSNIKKWSLQVITNYNFNPPHTIPTPKSAPRQKNINPKILPEKKSTPCSPL